MGDSQAEMEKMEKKVFLDLTVWLVEMVEMVNKVKRETLEKKEIKVEMVTLVRMASLVALDLKEIPEPMIFQDLEECKESQVSKEVLEILATMVYQDSQENKAKGEKKVPAERLVHLALLVQLVCLDSKKKVMQVLKENVVMMAYQVCQGQKVREAQTVWKELSV